MNAVFITGTDTDIGKTTVSCLLMRYYNERGFTTFGIKPIASGCTRYDGNLQNEDALALQAAATIKQPYSVVNPIALEYPIAPHLAAEKMGICLSKKLIKKAIISSTQKKADLNVIEGAGGWSVPINDQVLLSELIIELKIPVILVVGIKLGCLNHAISTYHTMINMQAPCIGWIANCLSPKELCIAENIATLRKWLTIPCLGVVPYNPVSSIEFAINMINHALL